MLPLVIVVVVLLVLAAITVRQVTVFEFERALLYRGGRFSGVVGPGSYWVMPRRTRIIKVDIRPRHIVVPGQEVITADGVGLKLTVSAKFAVEDAAKAVHSSVSYETAIYTVLQLALRNLVGASPVDAILSSRPEISERLYAASAPKADELGLKLHEAELKDIMFPGDLKKVFSQVVRARQEGLAALEKARGESAALRNLANAATLLEQRPSLMQLRILQALSQDGGNTIVVGLNGAPDMLPIRPVKKSSPPGGRTVTGSSPET
jgi:regulator of protease activity HflC (stomatin/prohibitin superfamily)